LQRAPHAQETIRSLANNPYGRPEDWVYDVVRGANECKSVGDTRELSRRLENELADALAVNTRCGGVTVIRNFDTGSSEKIENNQNIRQQKDYWVLFLDYNPGQKTYGWTLFPEKAGGHSAGPLVNGEGDTAKVADQICTVVTRRGAAIR